jgi:hypothetical protein
LFFAEAYDDIFSVGRGETLTEKRFRLNDYCFSPKRMMIFFRKPMRLIPHGLKQMQNVAVKGF